MDFDRKNWRPVLEGLRKPDNIFLLLKKIFFKERKSCKLDGLGTFTQRFTPRVPTSFSLFFFFFFQSYVKANTSR